MKDSVNRKAVAGIVCGVLAVAVAVAFASAVFRGGELSFDGEWQLLATSLAVDDDDEAADMFYDALASGVGLSLTEDGVAELLFGDEVVSSGTWERTGSDGGMLHLTQVGEQDGLLTMDVQMTRIEGGSGDADGNLTVIAEDIGENGTFFSFCRK